MSCVVAVPICARRHLVKSGRKRRLNRIWQVVANQLQERTDGYDDATTEADRWQGSVSDALVGFGARDADDLGGFFNGTCSLFCFHINLPGQ